jgi:hypothetical protein
MTIFGKKFDSGITRFANKVKHANVHKFANKIAHGIHKGLGVANKVISKVEDGAKYVANVSNKLEGIPIIGSAAGLVNVAANQVGTLSKSAKAGIGALSKMTDTGATKFGNAGNRIKNKGVAGLEKAVKGGLDQASKFQNLGDTIGKARKSIVDSKYNADDIGAQVQKVVNANPLKKNM